MYCVLLISSNRLRCYRTHSINEGCMTRTYSLMLAILCVFGLITPGVGQPQAGSTSRKLIVTVKDWAEKPVANARVEIRTAYAQKEVVCQGVASGDGEYTVEVPLAIAGMPLKLRVDAVGFKRFERMESWGIRTRATIQLITDSQAIPPPPAARPESRKPLYVLETQTGDGLILKPVSVAWKPVSASGMVPANDLEVRYRLEYPKGTQSGRTDLHSQWTAWTKGAEGNAEYPDLTDAGKYRFDLQVRNAHSKTEIGLQSAEFSLAWENPELVKDDIGFDSLRIHPRAMGGERYALLVNDMQREYERWVARLENSLRTLGLSSSATEIAPRLAAKISEGQMNKILDEAALQGVGITSASLHDILAAKQVAPLIVREKAMDLVHVFRDAEGNKAATMSAITYYACNYYKRGSKKSTPVASSGAPNATEQPMAAATIVVPPAILPKDGNRQDAANAASATPPVPSKTPASPAVTDRLVKPATDASDARATPSILPKGEPMVLVEGGWFEMGARKGDLDERPVHRVLVSSFYMDRVEVSVAEYKKFCDATGRSMPVAPPEGWSPNQPICNVSWEDAESYSIWAGKRLPTEAEWEYAARGGSQGVPGLFSGSTLPDKVAWYYMNAGARVNPGGQKEPNVLGLYDMSGNVWEWCADWYNGEAYAQSPEKDPRGADTGTLRVLRGGSWSTEVPDLRVTRRMKSSPSAAFFDYGFRCVKDVTR
jgi:formylglycine-generating enzyme